MSGFTPQALEKKLNDLNSSQQSIQTLSLWLIHHRKHCKSIVQTWFKELKKTKPTRRLTFMYLANDVIQNGKKKAPEFIKEFLSVLKPCFLHISKEADSASLASFDRLIKIWEERNVFDKAHLNSFRQALHPNEKFEETQKEKDNCSIQNKDNSLNLKSIRKRENDDVKDNGRSSKKSLTDQLDSTILSNMISKSGNLNLSPIDFDKCEKVEPEKLIKTMKDLQEAASADASVRDKIAKFPSEIFDTKMLESVVNQDSLEHWTKLVDEAQTILTSYNSRLAKELEDRKNLHVMLACFIEAQRRALSQAEQNLNDYRDKLRKVVSVREELKSHLQNLPDLSRLPSVTPLPSALDLFKL